MHKLAGHSEVVSDVAFHPVRPLVRMSLQIWLIIKHFFFNCTVSDFQLEWRYQIFPITIIFIKLLVFI